MKRRSVLGGLGALAGTSLAGCFGGPGNNGKTSTSPPWFRKATMDVNEKGTKGRLVIHISKKANVSEMRLYKPDDSLQTSVVVGGNQRRVGLVQVEVSTMPLSFYGINPGTYEIQAEAGDEWSERQPVDVVREFALNAVSMHYESSGGKEWVSGFEATVTNNGLYPYVLTNMGPVDGVPNPPGEDGPGGATPVEEGEREVVWWDEAKRFAEDRREGAGALVKPRDDGTPAPDELAGEYTATLNFVTTQDTHQIPVTYRLDGDLVETENGWAMSQGEVVSIDGMTPTGSATSTDG